MFSIRLLSPTPAAAVQLPPPTSSAPLMPELLTLGLVLVPAQGGGTEAHLFSILQAIFLATEN